LKVRTEHTDEAGHSAARAGIAEEHAAPDGGGIGASPGHVVPDSTGVRGGKEDTGTGGRGADGDGVRRAACERDGVGLPHSE
jgi:hypothetical protein